MTVTTKAEELAAVRALADRLGPESYLGPWLADALPWLADQLRADLFPQGAQQMTEEASRFRADACIDAIAIRNQAQADARRVTDEVNAWADRQREEIEAARNRAWDALRSAQKQLEQ